MIRYLLARLCHADWTAPLTITPADPVDDSAKLHELAAWEQQIRADAIRQHVRQADTAAGALVRRIGLFTEIQR